MKRLLILFLAAMLLSPPVSAASLYDEALPEAIPAQEPVMLGGLLDTIATPEHYIPGPRLAWGMTLEELMPELAGFANTQKDLGGGRSSIALSGQFAFSDIDAVFSITYVMDAEEKLSAVLYRTGPDEDNVETERDYIAVAAQMLEKIYEDIGQAWTRETIETVLRAEYDAQENSRTLLISPSGTFLAISMQYSHPGVTLLVGLQSYITPETAAQPVMGLPEPEIRDAPKMGLPE